MQTCIATVESTMEITQKIKNGSAFWPSDPVSRNISKGNQNTNLKEHKHSCIYCSVIYNHQDMEAKKILPFATVWMDLENIILSEISHSGKDKYRMISLIVESNEQTELTAQ